MMDSQSFPLFPNLPAEIRLKIYYFAISEPTIITFNNSRFSCSRNNDGSWGPCRDENHVFVTHRPIPSLFHVCAESRAVCLPKYTLGFDVSITKAKTLTIWPCAVNGHYDKALFEKHRRTRCRHEDRISFGLIKHIYWNPVVDIVHMKRLPSTEGGIGDDDWDASKIAYLWTDYHWTRLNIAVSGIRSVAMSLTMFGRWYRIPRRRRVRDVETLYVVLRRRVEDGGEEWDEHVSWFGRWFSLRMKSFMEHERLNADPLPLDAFQLKVADCVEGAELCLRDLERAVDWVEDTTGIWGPEDIAFQKERYPEIFR